MARRSLLFFPLVFLLACGPTRPAYEVQDPQYLHTTIKKITDIIIHDIFSPPVSSRIYAYVSVAAYEAARHQDTTFLTMAGQLHGLEPGPEPEQGVVYCFPLASLQATLKTGRALIFSEDKLDEFSRTVLEEYRTSGLPADVYERSLAFGTAVADHILSWSATDNYKQSRSFPKYSINQSPSTWKPTPPAYMDAVEPHWARIRTFVIDSASQFRPDPPPAFSADRASPFYKSAMEVYETGKSLTGQQREIAQFWDCNPFVINVSGHVSFANKKISPGGHWMNIVRIACRQTDAGFAQAANAYARVALALADGFIACWDEKYRSLLIRPESYINLYIDENWVPLLQTPPFPEYISGHSVISGAAASALTGTFGEHFDFVDSTEAEFGLTARSFESFHAAAREAAASRLYGGIHYREACDIGLSMGLELGEFIDRRLKTTAQAVINNPNPGNHE